MLIDSGHRRWIVGTVGAALLALAGYEALAWQAPGGLTGGSTVGLWYGVAGTLLMVYAGLLAAHRRLARWPWLPRRAWLLKGHIWLGLLSSVFLLCHSGFRWGGPLEMLLWIVYALILLSGLFGLALQHVLPRLLALRVAEETPYEQMPYVCQTLAQRAEILVEALCGPPASAVAVPTAIDARAQLRVYYEQEIRPFLHTDGQPRSSLHDPGQTERAFLRLRAMPGLVGETDRLVELETVCACRRQIAWQERLHHWLHGWLLVHVPLSLALLVLVVAHIALSLYY